MSTRERVKANERALKNARVLCNRQRRNMKAYVAIILNVKNALENNDALRALALVSGNIKYPPALLEEVMTECQHEYADRYVSICTICGDKEHTYG